ncbi:MAG: hypothetical protein KF752_03730 [Pirellulaceae bacterium]|nr:hypothetical protein [Pirellulaceae bacterium]
MNSQLRRHFLRQSAWLTSAGLLARPLWLGAQEPQVVADAQDTKAATAPPSLKIAPFRFDVTPPLGHALCGGWIKPVLAVDDPLEAIGYVLLGAGQPIVVCSVDWTGLLNEAHGAWCTALAQAAGTTPQRVAVQCVHQHDAPFACLEAQRIVAVHSDLPSMLDVDFFKRCLEAGQSAIETALTQPIEVTHIACAQAAVDRVASNRRLINLQGRTSNMRGSASRDPTHQRYPEGLIDPYLKSVAFYHGDRQVLACHYYACHPMSYYGRGQVSSDFCGLARKRLQAEQPDCTHLYFNGCGGNIGAGRYNDASEAMRPVLSDRMYQALVASQSQLQPQPVSACHWTTQDILPRPLESWNEDDLLKQIADANRSVVDRNRPAYIVSWLRRFQQGTPIVLSALHINEASLLHLPSECFVEYQLRAQVAAPERFVACAAYGDGGPWYIPTREAYPQGGYEVSVAWCDPEIDSTLSHGMAQLLAQTSSDS